MIRRWTPDEEALLSQLLKLGNNSTAIAARLKRTLRAVERKANELRGRAACSRSRGAEDVARKPLHRPWTVEDSAMLEKLLHEGKSHTEIAREMKRVRSVVENHALRRAELEMSELTFADYLAGRRSTYTQEWHLLQELRRDAAFRDARSSDDIERYLNNRDAALGIRSCARAAWTAYATALRKARRQP
jgi:hypothetical protein